MILLLTARHGYRSSKIKTKFFLSFELETSVIARRSLKKKQLGRGQRPLSTKEPIHVVFKTERGLLRHKSLRAPQSFRLVLKIIEKYAKHFVVKIEQLSVQHDHVHLLIRTSRRRHFHHFFRVVAGQIAQGFEKEGLLVMMTDTPQAALKAAKRLWKYRPFSRVVRGWRAYKTVRDYIQLNEQEVLGKIRYQKNRLRGLSSADWQILWR